MKAQKKTLLVAALFNLMLLGSNNAFCSAPSNPAIMKLIAHSRSGLVKLVSQTSRKFGSKEISSLEEMMTVVSQPLRDAKTSYKVLVGEIGNSITHELYSVTAVSSDLSNIPPESVIFINDHYMIYALMQDHGEDSMTRYTTNFYSYNILNNTGNFILSKYTTDDEDDEKMSSSSSSVKIIEHNPDDYKNPVEPKADLEKKIIWLEENNKIILSESPEGEVALKWQVLDNGGIKPVDEN